MAARRIALVVAGIALAACSADPGSEPEPTASEPTQDPATAACERIDYSDRQQGTQTFAEEFSGTRPDGTGLDAKKWRVRDDQQLDSDQAIIRKENVSVRDGKLNIVGRKLPSDQWEDSPSARYDWNRMRTYSTGYVDTVKGAGHGNAASDDRFSQQYGHFAIRAKLPSDTTNSRGIWPSFRLRSTSGAGEIVPMEAFGGPVPDGRSDASHTYFWGARADASESGSGKQQQAIVPGGESVSRDFHTFAVNWSPVCLRYTIDGRTVGMIMFSDADYLTEPDFERPFDLRLSLQVGSEARGPADDQYTRPEFTYQIDWVRVHQAKGQDGGGRNQPDPDVTGPAGQL